MEDSNASSNPSIHTVSDPARRTLLATVAMTRDGRAVVYMGEDARFEYIYKFVSRDRMQPGGAVGLTADWSAPDRLAPPSAISHSLQKANSCC